ncbi:MAG: AAA family ATPase [Alphaproteobacteria bacterium]|nr:AAA family ATPase [Alphaproteobacteria bacterium]
MRFRNLNLQAFGGFTNEKLDFGDGKTDLHIVLGPNEAGKSTMLDALGDLLYGIDQKSKHNYLHDYSDLRLSATIENSEGELSFVRKKGIKKTLLKEDGEAELAPEALYPFVSSDRSVFKNIFGLSHVTLREGGKDILDAEGDLGQTLYQASQGVGNLSAELRRVEEEAERIFKSRGSKSSLNAAISEHKVLTKEAKEATHTIKEWKGIVEGLEQARSEQGEIDEQLMTSKADQRKLERVKRTKPILTRLDEAVTRLQEYDSVPKLPENFEDEVKETKTKLIELSTLVGSKTEAIEKLRENLNGVEVADDVLALGGDIELMSELNAKAIAGEKDLKKRSDELKQLTIEAKNLLEQLDIDEEAESFSPSSLPSLSDVAEARAVSKRQERAVSEEEAARTALERISTDLKRLKNELEDLDGQGDVQALKDTLEESKLREDFEGIFKNCESTISEKTTALEGALSFLSMDRESLEALSGKTRPAEGEAQSLLSRKEDIRNELKSAQERVELSDEELAVAEAGLAVLKDQGDVPTQELLDTKRRQRDEAWQTIKGDVGVSRLPDQDLITSMDTGISESDDISDRMNAEASRVTEHQSLLKAIAKHRTRRNERSKSLDKAQELEEAWNAEWEELWKAHDLDPITVARAEEWLSQCELAVGLAGEIRALDTEREETKANALEDRQSLLDALNPLVDDDLEGKSRILIRQRAEEVLSDVLATKAAMRTLNGQVKEKEEDKLEAENLLKGKVDGRELLKQEWVGLAKSNTIFPSDLEKADIESVLEPLEKLRSKLTLVESMKGRVEAIQGDIEAYEEKVKELSVLPQFEGLDGSMIQIGAKMMETHGAAETNRDRADILNGQISETVQDNEETAEKMSLAEATLKSFCERAKVSKSEELQSVIDRFNQKVDLRSYVEDLEEQLSNEAMTVEELREEASGVDWDTINAQIELMEGNQAGLAEKREDVVRRIIEFERNKREISEADGSADPEQKVAQNLDVIVDEAERFILLKSSARLLRWAIEKHREEKQDPLLRGASELFNKLTVGNYERLKVETDDKDVLHLIGIKAGGKRVGVNGMSDGTRDQLYLAIRLAAIETFASEKKNGTLPFVADDLLVHFDGEREKATLSVLKELSKKTQVLVFTHHVHLIDAAKQSLGAEGFMLHEL